MDFGQGSGAADFHNFATNFSLKKNIYKIKKKNKKNLCAPSAPSGPGCQLMKPESVLSLLQCGGRGRGRTSCVKRAELLTPLIHRLDGIMQPSLEGRA